MIGHAHVYQSRVISKGLVGKRRRGGGGVFTEEELMRWLGGGEEGGEWKGEFEKRRRIYYNRLCIRGEDNAPSRSTSAKETRWRKKRNWKFSNRRQTWTLADSKLANKLSVEGKFGRIY